MLGVSAAPDAAAGTAAPVPYQTDNADRCDFIDPAVCLQPFPNDYFTVPDPTTDTGRRVNLNLFSMPQNRAKASATLRICHGWAGSDSLPFQRNVVAPAAPRQARSSSSHSAMRSR